MKESNRKSTEVWQCSRMVSLRQLVDIFSVPSPLSIIRYVRNRLSWDFLDGPMAKTLSSQRRGPRFKP